MARYDPVPTIEGHLHSDSRFAAPLSQYWDPQDELYAAVR